MSYSYSPSRWVRLSVKGCIKTYLVKTFSGLCEALCFVARADYGKLFEENRGKVLDLLRKLYGEEAAELLLKLLEETCFKNKGVKKGVEDA